ncbi:hypothetical protein [Agrobacterium sp.]|uniref:hypothetical protein n=1 Tax=Agrobacterium sp. TaxID=361 RepID=UPI00289704A0|nr:hypothetical protein [Agrobacterium sp.]
MSKKPITPLAEIDTNVDTVETNDVTPTSDNAPDSPPPNDVVVDELYDATLTKTVKHAGEWHYPGTVFEGIDVDFASALQAAGAADITPSKIA